MSTEQQELPGPHVDRSREGATSPARWDNRGPDPVKPARAYYGDVLRFPGYGQQPDRCLKRKPVGFCDLEGHVTLASASPCETRRCPEHWDLWQREAAVNMVARLAAYRHVQEGAGKRLLHVVDSPDPERRWSAEAFWDERSDSYDVLRGVGGRGGVTVPHPYRTSDEGDWLFREAVERGDWEKDWGKWSLLRRTADDWEQMQQFIQPGPHYHHLVAAEDFDPDAVPDRRTVKNIRSLERFHIRDMTGYRDMARVAMYLLSHAAYQPKGADGSGGRNTVTYWGDVHPNGFNPEEELTRTEWDRIQSMAERAVTTRPGDDLREAQDEPDATPCPHDDCEGHVVPLDELRDWLGRDEWVRSIGHRQRRILKGVLIWLDNMGDRPPPSSNEERIREWLWSWGKQRERTEQAGLFAHS
jgi:hypothetical protein